MFPKNGDLKVNGSIPRERNVDFLQELFYIPEELVLQKLSQEEYLKRYAFFYPNFITTRSKCY